MVSRFDVHPVARPRFQPLTDGRPGQLPGAIRFRAALFRGYSRLAGAGLVLLALLSGTFAEARPATKARVSICPFPYDLTQEAVDRVTSLVQSNADVYTVQLDNGVPWKEALSGQRFSANLLDQWKRHKDSIAPHHQVYVAIAPLAEDRTSWAEPHGGGRAPAWARDETRLTEEMKIAYGRYVLRVVEYFHPDYLNIGVESGDMAAKLPKKWPVFEALFTATAEQVRKHDPRIKIGISTGLPFMQMPGVLDRMKGLLNQCDYVGISFYPYMSQFYEKFGAPALPPPPAQWREPLAWLKQRVTKPIAICETGYSSEPLKLPKFGLALSGDTRNQALYAEDLAAIAQRDQYLFSVFFLAVDYDALMDKMMPGDERPRLWGRTGFFDKNGAAKPAWRSFQAAWLQPSADAKDQGSDDQRERPGKGERPIRREPGKPAPGGPVPAAAGTKPGELAFATSADLFAVPTSDKVSLEKRPDAGSFMRWKYTYSPGQFAWAMKTVPAGTAQRCQSLTFELRSDRTDPLLLQIEESDGEAFYCVVQPTAKWETVQKSWSDFTVAAGKKKNGVIDPERIVRIMIADGAANDKKATGARTVELGSLAFTSGSSQ